MHKTRCLLAWALLGVAACIFAESDVWSKIDGEWKVVHIHYQEVPGEN